MDAIYPLDPELVAFHKASQHVLQKFNDGTHEPPRLAASVRPSGEPGG